MTQLYARTPQATNTAFSSPATQRPVAAAAAGYSVTGIRHQVNQDRFLVDDQRGLYIVADGMGGCRAGERASHMAVDLLAYHPALVGCERLSTEATSEAIGQAFVDANQEIVTTASMDSQLYGMGTTAVLALMVRDRLYLASLGDSRAYVLRDGQLQLYTVDHNMAQTLVQLGVISREDAREHQWRNILWQYLGVAELQDGPDVNVVSVTPGDRVLLVTDGVTETLTARDMTTILDTHPKALEASETLVRAAVARGTRDDATAVVLDIAAAGSHSQS